VIAETRGNVTPFGKERLVRCAASDIAADGHRAESAAVVALTARDDSIASRLFSFEMVLADQLDCGFRGFGASGSEIDAAGVAEIGRGECEQPRGEFFGGSGVELRRVSESDLRRLLRHGAADFGDAVTDADDRGLARGVEKVAAVGGMNPAAFATHGDGEGLMKISREETCVRRHAMSAAKL
jgi:hypothetical protein